jgi:hypothetical protein
MPTTSRRGDSSTPCRAPPGSPCRRTEHLNALVHVGELSEPERHLRRSLQRVGLGLLRLPLGEQEALSMQPASHPPPVEVRRQLGEFRVRLPAHTEEDGLCARTRLETDAVQRSLCPASRRDRISSSIVG